MKNQLAISVGLSLVIGLATTACTSLDMTANDAALPQRAILSAYDVPFTVSDVESSNVDVEILGKVSQISEEQYFTSENADLGTEQAIYFRIVTIEVSQSKTNTTSKYESFLIHSDLNPTNDLSSLGTGDTVVVYGNEINTEWTGEPLRVPELLAEVDFEKGLMTSLKRGDEAGLPLPSWVER